MRMIRNTLSMALTTIMLIWACSDGHEPVAPQEQTAAENPDGLNADATKDSLEVEREDATLGSDADSQAKDPGDDKQEPGTATPSDPSAPAANPSPAPAFYPSSCADIKKSNPDARSGVYKIYLNADSPQRMAVEASCDMSEDGGGWTLALNYLHKANSNPDLVIHLNALPLQGSETLGTDESGQMKNWGHAGNAMLSNFPMKELRFYCRSSQNTRIVHFKSQDPGCITAVQKGSGSCVRIRIGSVALTGHSGILPSAADTALLDQKDLVLTSSPFYAARVLNDVNWNIRANNSNWECDSSNSGAAFDTLHRVWFR